MSRVLFAGGGTGGHLYPALAIAEAMRRERPGIEIHFVGAERGIEARVLPEEGVDHTLLPIEPIRRDEVWRNWRLAPSLARTALGLNRLYRRFPADLVVGTGGYASGPACGWAVLRGHPVALQEQNSYPGLTTRWLSRWARQVHLGFPEAEHHLHPGSETRIFAPGNPIRPPDPALDPAACRRAFGLADDGVVCLVVGGSQGALPINEAILGMLAGIRSGSLEPFPEGLQLLWATGPKHVDAVSDRLGELRQGNEDVFGGVHPIGYIRDMPKALAAADLAISRAGAMGTAELLAWGVPSILVPLPTAAANHQAHNAEALERAGAAVHLSQPDATPEHLRAVLGDLVADDERRDRMSAAARERGRPRAAQEMAERMLTLVEAR